MKESRFIVLDLDNTLLYSKPVDFTHAKQEDERAFHINLISHRVIYKVTLRKHFKLFMDELFAKGYRVIVWSAGDDKYVKDIVSVVFKEYDIEYTMTSKHLIDGKKKLDRIGYFIPDFNIENCRLIDDNLDHRVGQEKYFIGAKPFTFKNFSPDIKEDEDDGDHLLTILDKINGSFSKK